MLREAKVALQLEMARMEDATQEEVAMLKDMQAKELITLRLDFEATMKELEQKYERRLGELRDDLELRRKVRGAHAGLRATRFCVPHHVTSSDGDSRNRRAQKLAHQ